jgi:hypothetical protein
MVLLEKPQESADQTYTAIYNTYAIGQRFLVRKSAPACSCKSESLMKTIEAIGRWKILQKIPLVLPKIYYKWWYDKYLLNSCANKWKVHAQWTIFRKKLKMQFFRYFPPITAIRAFKSQKFDQKQFYRPQISRNRYPYCYSSEVLKKLLPVTCPQWSLVQFFLSNLDSLTPNYPRLTFSS